jgi:hypothetical protein
MFALALALTGIENQPNSAVPKDLIKPSVYQLTRAMRPDTGRNTCFTTAG